MRDRLVPGTELAVYWIEHVLRHGNTKHLQVSSKYVPLYQKYLVDVVLFLAVILVVMLTSSYYTVRFLISKCLQRNNPVKSKTKNK
jgi:glucuronosyltransferase